MPPSWRPARPQGGQASASQGDGRRGGTQAFPSRGSRCASQGVAWKWRAEGCPSRAEGRASWGKGRASWGEAATSRVRRVSARDCPAPAGESPVPTLNRDDRVGERLVPTLNRAIPAGESPIPSRDRHVPGWRRLRPGFPGCGFSRFSLRPERRNGRRANWAGLMAAAPFRRLRPSAGPGSDKSCRPCRIATRGRRRRSAGCSRGCSCRRRRDRPPEVPAGSFRKGGAVCDSLNCLLL